MRVKRAFRSKITPAFVVEPGARGHEAGGDQCTEEQRLEFIRTGRGVFTVVMRLRGNEARRPLRRIFFRDVDGYVDDQPRRSVRRPDPARADCRERMVAADVHGQATRQIPDRFMLLVQGSGAVEETHGCGPRRRTGMQQGAHRRTALDETPAECGVHLVQSRLHLPDGSVIQRARVRRRQLELLLFDGGLVPTPPGRMWIDRQNGARQRASIRRDASRPVVRLHAAVPLALRREMAVHDLYQRWIGGDHEPVAHDVRE